MRERLPVVQLGSNDSPFIAKLIMEFEHGLFLGVAPFSFGVIRVNEGDIAEW